MPRLIPPGPRGIEALRFFGGGSFAKTLEFFRAQSERYGPISSLRILGRRLYLLDDPELVREVLVVQQHKFARASGAALLRDVVGVSVVTAEEPLHRERRRLLQPAFHRKLIAGYGAVMVDESEAAANRFTACASIDVGAEMLRLTLRVIGRAFFSSDVGGYADKLDAALTRAMRSLATLGPVLEIAPAWLARLRPRLSLRSNAEFAAARREIKAVVDEVIARRRPGDGEDDVLALLLRARDDEHCPLDDQGVADELATLLLAGHETTAIALTWAWYLLAHNPAAEAKLHAELDEVLGGRLPAVDDVPNLPYTERVFAETLRLYPPASAFGRRAIEPCRLGPYTVAPGDGVVLSPFVSHRNPRYFPDPLAFLPDRWETPEWPAFAYFPFGGGARRCIGDEFARLEGVLALATIARRLRLVARDGRAAEIASHATLRPRGAIELRPVTNPQRSDSR